MEIDESDVIEVTDNYVDVSIKEAYFRYTTVNGKLHAALKSNRLHYKECVFTLGDSEVVEVSYNVEKNILTADRNVILRFFKDKK